MSNIEEIRKPVEAEFAEFQRYFKETLRSDNPLLQNVLDHVLMTSGKQLRPLLVLLSARMCHGVSDKTIQVATALELLHTASLIHDDVVDDSPTRRGAPSVHARWNNKVAVLVGDYFLAKVIELTANLRNVKILNIFSSMIKTLSSGELLQLHSNHSMWISEEQYYRVIDEKTAALFAACMEAGAASSGATMKQTTALENFGRELGLVFQMKDDVLDYSEQEIGKPTMSDVLDGKATLPLICALSRAPKAEADEIKTLAEGLRSSVNQKADLQTIHSFVMRYDGIGYTAKQMALHKEKALASIEMFHDSPAKRALIQILQYTIIRSY